MEIKVSLKSLGVLLCSFALILFLIFIIMKFQSNSSSPSFTLDKNLEMGATTLYVENLETTGEFYVNIVGLEILNEDVKKLTLGIGKTEVIKLEQKDELDFPPRNAPGLYHNAIVYKDPAYLAATLERILLNSPDSFEGPGDHGVSIAFYFHDPEGNGLELYYDRPRSEWDYDQQGRVMMKTEYYDPLLFISRYKKESLEVSNKMGHVHLKVSDIAAAKDFYHGVLGFDITAEMPSALFMSVDGYHHHLAVNTWHSADSMPRGEFLGLGSFEIELSSIKELDRLEKQFESKSVNFVRQENTVELSDPSGNRIEITAK